jgi:hypothetical protein
MQLSHPWAQVVWLCYGYTLYTGVRRSKVKAFKSRTRLLKNPCFHKEGSGVLYFGIHSFCKCVLRDFSSFEVYLLHKQIYWRYGKLSYLFVKYKPYRKMVQIKLQISSYLYLWVRFHLRVGGKFSCSSTSDCPNTYHFIRPVQ